MSLDVYLSIQATTERRLSGIFVREDGRVKEILRADWDERNPGHEPTIADSGPLVWREVFWRNITHNLGPMARLADLYLPCWHPDQIGAGIKRAGDLAPLLRDGLATLRAMTDEDKKKTTPENGWGSYDGLVDFAEAYLAACEEHPDAEVTVSR